MDTFNTFEKLDCWKKAREEANMVYDYLTNCRDFTFRDQMNRASISTMNNIAEGYGRWSNKEKINFMNIANGSFYEVRSMAYLGLDRGYFTIEQTNALLSHNQESIKTLQGFIRHLQNK